MQAKQKDRKKMYLLIISIKRRIDQECSSISRQNLNENLETRNLACTLFYHLPSFYLKTGFLNPHPLSLVLTIFILMIYLIDEWSY